jgi:hypothetical protein
MAEKFTLLDLVKISGYGKRLIIIRTYGGSKDWYVVCTDNNGDFYIDRLNYFHVFYLQSQVIQDKEKKKVRNIFIKRGTEWHGPDLMYINTQHIVVIEAVGTNSKVTQLINEAKTKEEGTK